MLQNMAKMPLLSALLTTSNNKQVSKEISSISPCIKKKSYKITRQKQKIKLK